MGLSVDDISALESLNKKLRLVRDRVRGVKEHLHLGFYLSGEGGNSKSYTVIRELDDSEADYLIHNSRMTGRGLVDALQNAPTAIHVLEDCETIFNDKRAWGVLRSALWSQSENCPQEREITWAAHQTTIRFTFTGGIIMIANRPLENIPELRAIKTRITTLKLVTTFAEIAALMRSVALKGLIYGEHQVSPGECLEVAEFVIKHMASLDRPLDMRVYQNGVKDYLQWRIKLCETEWKDMIESRLKETTSFRETRTDSIIREEALAEEINSLNICYAEKIKLWEQRTKSEKYPKGRDRKSFDRRVNRRTQKSQ